MARHHTAGSGRTGKHALHAGIEQALAQDPLPDHSDGAEQQNVYADGLRAASFQKRFSSIRVIR